MNEVNISLEFLYNLLNGSNLSIKLLTACSLVLILEVGSGVYKAILKKDLNSTKFREGLFGKIGYFILIILAYLISIITNQFLIVNVVVGWIILSEATSILENLAQANLPIPSFFKKILTKIKDTLDTPPEK